jgi:carbamoyltransferase
MEEALVITADGAGEYDSTVIWQADESGLTRISTHPSYNSLGRFFGSVTEYLGYHANNGEGKVMGLAPYGSENTEIRERLYSVASFGVDYDVTAITAQGIQNGAKKLEDVLGRPQRSSIDGFDDFEKDLAYTAQRLVEETIVDITTAYVRRLGVKNVCLAGGVALNCKMNKKVMEINEVDNFFVQPVAHDAGLALGAGWLESEPSTVQPMTNVYWGPSWDQRAIQDTLDEAKISYKNEEDVPKHVAREIASGRLVGWFQGRQEMGPRALGNRSILADPRTKESRDRVNKFVKHREEWRPFAPSILEGKADEYLQSYTQSPYMIKTFDTHPEIQDQIRAVVHPSDNTTRPQTVNESQNPKYYEMITEFENITDVPAVLNTSFNDHAEPIVTTPSEAIRDFYSMGLDTLAIGDFIIEK